MDNQLRHTIAGILIAIYFAVATVCILTEMFEWKEMLFFFKPLLMPTLIAAYLFASDKRNPIYIVLMLLALSSNIFLLWSTPEFLLYSSIAILINRILTIYVVVKLTGKVLLLPFVIATIPFIFVFSCLINMTMTADSMSFYPTIINGLLIAALSGISLSQYVLNDNRANSWLAISTLLFVVLVFLFMIEKYYISNIAFLPMSAFVFSIGHYAFYRFVLEAEKPEKEKSYDNGPSLG